MNEFKLVWAPVLMSCLLLSACKKESTSNDGLAASEQKAPAAQSAVKSVSDTAAKKTEQSIQNATPSNAEDTKPTALALGEFKIVALNLGTAVDEDNAVTNPKTVFKTSDKIYASVLSTGKHPGLKIQARWTAPDGKLVAKTEQAIVPTTAMVSTFSIDHDKAWPVGAYTLEISLNEQVQKSTSFEIR
jgi:hypothetical protein